MQGGPASTVKMFVAAPPVWRVFLARTGSAKADPHNPNLGRWAMPHLPVYNLRRHIVWPPLRFKAGLCPSFPLTPQMGGRPSPRALAACLD
jgi:hypothetical protein